MGIFLIFLGCRADPNISANDDTGPMATTDVSLAILHPVANSVVPWGEPTEFTAAIYDANGGPLPWKDIVWTSSEDDTWVRTGATIDDDDLDVGVHTLTATAVMDNGAVVTESVEGIRVQHKDAGVYYGETRVDLGGEYKGQDLTSACFGFTTMVVDLEGKAAEGETKCTLAILGVDLDLLFDFEFDVADGDMVGTANLDFDLFAWPFEANGRVRDAEIDASWGENIEGFVDVQGNMDLVRVNDDPSWEP